MNSFCSAKNSNSDDAGDIDQGKTMGPLVVPLTHPTFPIGSGTVHDVHVDDPTEDKYSNSDFTEVLHIQPSSRDLPFNAKDVDLGDLLGCQ